MNKKYWNRKFKGIGLLLLLILFRLCWSISNMILIPAGLFAFALLLLDDVDD